jgi:hypothetical protein
MSQPFSEGKPATPVIDYKLELYHGLVLEAPAFCPARLEPAHMAHTNLFLHAST